MVLRPQFPRRTGLVGVAKAEVLNHLKTVLSLEASSPVPRQSPYSVTNPPRLPSEPLFPLARMVNGRPVRALTEPLKRQSRRIWRTTFAPEPGELFARAGTSGISYTYEKA